jgi:hypothetical protein
MRAASLTGRLLAVKGRSAATALLNRAVSAPSMPPPPDVGQREPVMDARPTLDMAVTDAATPHQTIAAAHQPYQPQVHQPVAVAPEMQERPPLMQPKKVVRMPMPAVVPAWAAERAAETGKKKISVRLDAPRHFRMKLVAFKMNWSAQELMIRAFDRLVKKVAPEFVDALPPAEEAPQFPAEAEETSAMLEASAGRAD